MAMHRSDFVVLALIASNVAFLGWVGSILHQSYAGTEMPVATIGGSGATDKKAGVKAVAQRALSVHLPLSGMPEADPLDPDACMRLEGFLIDATHHLSNEGVTPPLTRKEITQLAAKQQCAITDATVREVIAEYTQAWIGAGLPEIGPFTAG